jgi:hypothetical protein
MFGYCQYYYAFKATPERVAFSDNITNKKLPLQHHPTIDVKNRFPDCVTNAIIAYVEGLQV